MILYSAPLSPYSRKIRMTLLDRELASDVEIHNVNPLDNDPAHLAANPLAKIPALQLRGSGVLLSDSRLILDYLDSLGEHLTPLNWPQRNLVVLAEGVMDLAYGLVVEGRRPLEQQSANSRERLQDNLKRTLAVLEQHSDQLADEGSGRLEVTLCCALGYLDFRLPEQNWRELNADLKRWYQGFSQTPAALATTPQE